MVGGLAPAVWGSRTPLGGTEAGDGTGRAGAGWGMSTGGIARCRQGVPFPGGGGWSEGTVGVVRGDEGAELAETARRREGEGEEAADPETCPQARLDTERPEARYL